MAGVDSGIKVSTDTAADIAALEKKKKAFVIMQIGKPEGSKIDKVLTKLALTTDEVAEAMGKGEFTFNDAQVKLQKKGDETDVWCVFRSCLATLPIAYGSCFVDYKTKDGRDSDKLVYIIWNTDNAGVKDKMVYSSTKVMNKFSSTPVKHQASDTDDITYAEICDVVKK